MKKCRFCAENIHENSVTCKHCGKFQDPGSGEEKTPWYFRKAFILFAVCSVGPLALPLIWWRPQTTLTWKIGLTLGILVLSWVLFQISMESIGPIEEYYKLLKGL